MLSNLKTHQKKGGALIARGTWSRPESKLGLNYLELRWSFLALKEFQDLCLNHSGCQYKQERRHEVGPLVCPTMENPDLMLQETGDSQS